MRKLVPAFWLCGLLAVGCHPTTANNTPRPTPAVAANSEVAALIEQLGDKDLPKSRAALKRLAALGPAAAPATEKIVTAFFYWNLDEKDHDIYRLAEDALVKIEPAAAPAVIVELGTDEMEGIAESILKRMGKPVIPAVIKALGNKDTVDQPRIFTRLADILGDFGPAAKAAIPVLEKAPKLAGDPSYTKTAREAIRRIRETAPQKRTVR